MDLLFSLGSDLTPDQLKINSDIASGKDILMDMMDADYKYTLTCDLLSALLDQENNANEIVNYFALENYSDGLEGFIGDAWFKFKQFIKKIIATVKVMFDHFWSGINRKESYLKDMRIKLRSSIQLNWTAMQNSEIKAYTPARFEEVIKTSEQIEKILESVFESSDFNIDDKSDFEKYGITFENGLIKKNGATDPYSNDSQKFNLGLEPNAAKSLGSEGWNQTNTAKYLDELVNRLAFHNKKDYLFIKFKYATEALIRKLDNDDYSKNRDKINRLRNTLSTVTSMMLYLTRIITHASNQMVSMCHILESKIEEKPKPEVEW